jgi:hypothetical protein
MSPDDSRVGESPNKHLMTSSLQAAMGQIDELESVDSLVDLLHFIKDENPNTGIIMQPKVQAIVKNSFRLLKNRRSLKFSDRFVPAANDPASVGHE